MKTFFAKITANHRAQLFCLVILFALPSLSFSQQAQGRKYKNHTARFLDKEGNELQKGKIYDLKDSSIVMLNTISEPKIKTEIAVTNIESIRITESNGVPKGLLIGGAIGGVSGVLVGIVSGNGNGPLSTVAPGMIGFGLGGLIGAVSGKQGKTISLYRHQKAYEMEKDKLRDYSFL